MFVSTDRSLKRKVLEIRQDSHGNTVVILEGYTETGKLFSLRGKTTPDIVLGGLVSAHVYGSGPGHQRLGDAEMTLDVVR